MVSVSTTRCLQLSMVAALCGACICNAATVWDEAASGDLSNDGTATSVLTMAPGSNVVIGTVGRPGTGPAFDQDYFTFTVPPGSTLEAITLLANTVVTGSVGFIAMQPGPQVTYATAGIGVLIAVGHYANDQVGSNLLPSIQIGAPGPLPSGTYSVWIQETSSVAPYGLDFVIRAGNASVPALPGAGLIVLGAALAAVVSGARARRAGPSGTSSGRADS